MDFDHLITFLEIAKQGSFSRAGQKLYRSQPAVSAQIRQLEQEYGQKLFDRVGKSVRLTVAGETSAGIRRPPADVAERIAASGGGSGNDAARDSGCRCK